MESVPESSVEVKIEQDIPQTNERASRDQQPEDLRKIFVGGLSAFTTEATLKEYYSKWGEIVDSVVMYDPITKRSRGFGFVTYAQVSQAEEAMSHRPHSIDGRTVDPKRAIPRDFTSEARVSTPRLYISGIRDSLTVKNLEDYFSSFGTVKNAEIIQDRNTGRSRGFAFLTFDDCDSADKCVIVRYHEIEGVKCDVKKALSKEQLYKTQQLERDRTGRMERSRGDWSRGSGSRGYVGDMYETSGAVGYGRRDRYDSPGRYGGPYRYGSRDPWENDRRNVSPGYSSGYDRPSRYDSQDYRGVGYSHGGGGSNDYGMNGHDGRYGGYEASGYGHGDSRGYVGSVGGAGWKQDVPADGYARGGSGRGWFGGQHGYQNEPARRGR